MKQSILDSTPLVVSQESIAFQSRAFGQEIEQFFAEIKAACTTKIDLKAFAKPDKLEKIIKNYTGMTVAVKMIEPNIGGSPRMIPPTLSRDSILLKDMSRNTRPGTPLTELIRSVRLHKDHNGVDLKTGRVFGVFEDVTSYLVFPPAYVLSKLFTAGECAAMTLHEIGHSMTYFEYIDRTITTNQILASMSESLTLHEDAGIRANLIKDVQKELKLIVDNPEELARKEYSVITASLIKASDESHKSAVGSNLYDETSAEQLADQYVVRCGYGRELATAVDKYSPLVKRDADSMRAANYVAAAGVIIPAVCGLLVVPPMMFGIAAYVAALRVSTNMTDKQDFTYDNTMVRLQRIREDIIRMTKSGDLSQDELKSILADVEHVDEAIKNSHDNSNIFRTIADFLFSDSRHAANTMKLHRQLEELASNDLFLAAAKLKTL